MPMRRGEVVKLVLIRRSVRDGWHPRIGVHNSRDKRLVCASRQPSFSPPNWLFGPVWTILYALMGVSLFLIWRAEGGEEGRKVRHVHIRDAGRAELSVVMAFFGLHSPLLGIVAIIALWVAIFLTILGFRKISANASLLLIPYIVWVSFAALLNFYIFILN